MIQYELYSIVLDINTKTFFKIIGIEETPETTIYTLEHTHTKKKIELPHERLLLIEEPKEERFY